MIITEVSPKGIGSIIYKLQNILEGKLCNTADLRFNWPNDTMIYGQVEKNVKDGKEVPGFYVGTGEHIQPFFNDNYSASIGFSVNSNTFSNWVGIADIDLICTVDLVKLYKNENRNIGKSVNDIYEIIHNQVLEMGIVKEGVSDVFRSFSTGKDFFPADLSNWFVFSINFKTVFNYKN